MSPREVVLRAGEQARRRAWRRRQVLAGAPAAPVAHTPYPRFTATLDPARADHIPQSVRDELIAAADALLAGKWRVLGVDRDDLVAPDWFLDPRSGVRAPSDRYAFNIQHRSEAVAGNVKQVWELSRHQHLTMLAAAYFVTGDPRYAQRTAEHLESWWSENPFLSGIHWTSGIEIGLRLISWAWIRRLLDGWPGVADLFEHNESALRQIWWHQQYLDDFRSIGTSANNHAVAESAGQLVAACAFPWFEESEHWRSDAQRRFVRELADNTFASGVNRELASEYHRFVAELAFLAAGECDAAGSPLPDDTWRLLFAMVDAAANLLDSAGRPPRQGDGDDGYGMQVDGSPCRAWLTLVALGTTIFGACERWPHAEPTVFSTLVGALASRHPDAAASGAGRWHDHVDDAGITLLRAPSATGEIWCRCDAGPHGFLATAAHGHADALSIEVRHDGIDIFADPGTYCYHDEPEWRSFFRSTRAHNTLELEHRDQSRSGGPFLWTRVAQTHLLELEYNRDGAIDVWSAEHDGYETLEPPARHRRSVRLDRERRRLIVVDRVDTAGNHAVALRFHLGPTVNATIDDGRATLRWTKRGRDRDSDCTATLWLPAALSWSAHRGEQDPIQGWYSPSFGVRIPSVTLVGTGRCDGQPLELRSELEFHC
jgi:hypothetical protein